MFGSRRATTFKAGRSDRSQSAERTRPSLPTRRSVFARAVHVRARAQDTTSINQILSDAACTTTQSRIHRTLKGTANPSQEDHDRGLLECIAIFNESANKGIDELVHRRIISRTPQDVANFLLETSGLSHKQVGEFLGGEETFNREVLSHYLQQFSFKCLCLDDAMRVFFSGFMLPGESQIIDRIVETFAHRFSQCNPNTLFGDASVAFVLAFSLIMLNTDLHNPEISSKMTKDKFIEINSGLHHGHDFPEKLLSEMYDRIKTHELKLMTDNAERNVLFLRPEHSGFLRKRRGAWKSWKTRWVILKNNCLFYFKNPQDVAPLGTIPLANVNVSFSLTQPLAFELIPAHGRTIKSARRSANGRVNIALNHMFVFAASNTADRNTWVRMIQKSLVVTGSDVLRSRAVSGRSETSLSGVGGQATNRGRLVDDDDCSSNQNASSTNTTLTNSNSTSNNNNNNNTASTQPRKESVVNAEDHQQIAELLANHVIEDGSGSDASSSSGADDDDHPKS